MSKKANLATTLAEVGGSTRMKTPAPTETPPQEEKQESMQVYKQPSRKGTKPITVHFPKRVRDQLKIMAVENNTTLQNLLAEAFNDLFAKYGKPEIAPRD